MRDRANGSRLLKNLSGHSRRGPSGDLEARTLQGPLQQPLHVLAHVLAFADSGFAPSARTQRRSLPGASRNDDYPNYFTSLPINHDGFGSKRSKAMTMIDSNILERDASKDRYARMSSARSIARV
jgi:hypothetical protein